MRPRSTARLLLMSILAGPALLGCGEDDEGGLPGGATCARNADCAYHHCTCGDGSVEDIRLCIQNKCLDEATACYGACGGPAGQSGAGASAAPSDGGPSAR